MWFASTFEYKGFLAWVRIPHVAPIMQITDRAGIYWCLILVAAEVRVLWSAPSFESVSKRSHAI